MGVGWQDLQARKIIMEGNRDGLVAEVEQLGLELFNAHSGLCDSSNGGSELRSGGKLEARHRGPKANGLSVACSLTGTWGCKGGHKKAKGGGSVQSTKGQAPRWTATTQWPRRRGGRTSRHFVNLRVGT